MKQRAPWEAAVARGGSVVALVRHGQTAWNAQRRFLGTTDIPLNEVGRAQAASLAAAIPTIATLYSSPLSRAYQTAEALHAAPIAVPDLRELSQGELEGMHGVDAMAKYPDFFRAWAEDPTDVVVPGGESLSQVQQRSLAALDGIAADHPTGIFGAVTHQMVIATLCCAAVGAPLSEWRQYGVKNASVTVLWRTGSGWQLDVHGWTADSAGSESRDV